jgi:prolyl-tRNA synthetase
MTRQEGITVKKSANFSEWYDQVVFKTGLADIRYNVQGFIVHMPWGYRILREILDMFGREMEKDGHEPLMFPSVILEDNLKKEGEHFGFVPEVFWVTEKGVGEKLEKKMALRPTSETAFYPMYALWIRSYRDLPMKRYQSVTAYRNEPVTRPFLRGREFIFMEAHDAFETHDEAEKQILRDIESMKEIFLNNLGIPVMFFKRPHWDRFLGAEETFAADTLMPDGRVLQIGTTHDLGQKFSVPFGIKFADKNEQEKFVWQTSYGPGIWRALAAMVAIHGDDKGLVIPFAIAPIQISIVPIFYSNKDEKSVRKKCESLMKKLQKKYRVHLDDSNKTPGEKFHETEMRGIPIRIEIGSKEVSGKFVTLYRRDNASKEKVKESLLEKSLEKASEGMMKEMKRKAVEGMEARISSPKTKNDFYKAIGEGNIARVNFCGREECAKDMQNDTKGAKVRGTSMEKSEKAIGKCVYCNHQAREVVYIAKQY